MLHIGLIAAHAASGLVALACGLFVFQKCPGRTPNLVFRVYLGALWLTVLCLVAVVTPDWTGLNQPSRPAFGALTLFALYIGRWG